MAVFRAVGTHCEDHDREEPTQRQGVLRVRLEGRWKLPQHAVEAALAEIRPGITTTFNA